VQDECEGAECVSSKQLHSGASKDATETASCLQGYYDAALLYFKVGRLLHMVNSRSKCRGMLGNAHYTVLRSTQTQILAHTHIRTHTHTHPHSHPHPHPHLHPHLQPNTHIHTPTLTTVDGALLQLSLRLCRTTSFCCCSDS